MRHPSKPQRLADLLAPEHLKRLRWEVGQAKAYGDSLMRLERLQVEAFLDMMECAREERARVRRSQAALVGLVMLALLDAAVLADVTGAPGWLRATAAALTGWLFLGGVLALLLCRFLRDPFTRDAEADLHAPNAAPHVAPQAETARSVL